MSNIFGYLKTSANENGIRSKLDQLKAVGVKKIYQDSTSRKKINTTQLDKLLAEVQKGDTLVVTSLSGVAHNTKHLLETMRYLRASGVLFKVLDSGIDTSTSQGETMDVLLGAIVDFEQHIARERQAEGIARAKREGRYKGRKPTARAKADEVLALNEKGFTRQKIADELGIGVASVYRILKTNTEPEKPKRRVVKKPKNTVDKPKREESKKPTEDTNEQLSFF